MNEARPEFPAASIDVVVLTLKDGKLHADNTDGSGFIASIRAGAPHWDPAAGPAEPVTDPRHDGASPGPRPWARPAPHARAA